MYFYDYSNILAKLPRGWTDHTYGNDMCPSAGWFYPPMKAWLKLYMDYPDQNRREVVDADRFIICVYTSYPNPDPHSDMFEELELDEMLGNGFLLSTESEVEMLEYIHSEQMIEDLENYCMENDYE
jgi:hypothetical protein